MAQVLIYSTPSNGTDDTPSIQAALNSLSPDGGELVFGNLTYLVSSLALYSNITIFGNGVTFKQIDNANWHILNGVTLTNLRLNGINFDGNKNNQTGNFSNAIALEGCKDIILENLHFNNVLKRAIQCYFITNGEEIIKTERVFILNCSANDIGNESTNEFGSFIDCDSCNDIKINNVTLNDIYGVIALAVRTENYEISNFNFKNNNFDNGVSIANCKNVKINNGIINNMLHCGIEINGTTNFNIDNIEIFNCVLYGILIATYVDLPYINGQSSKYGSINNTKIYIGDPSGNYADIFISGSQHISMNNITTNYDVRLGKAVINGSDIFSEFITLKNSLLNNLSLQYTNNVTLTNNSISTINNTNSSYALIKDANKFDIFFKTTAANNQEVSFSLPVFSDFINSNVLDCGLVNGFVTVDNGFNANPVTQFTSEIYHVRSMITTPSAPMGIFFNFNSKWICCCKKF